MGFGLFSTNWNAGQISSSNVPDRLFKVEEVKCHGHASLVRGLSDYI